MSVKRFDMHGSSDINGVYVSYSDCAKLEYHLAALKEENERLVEINGDLAIRCNDLTEDNIELDIAKEENRSLKARVAELEAKAVRDKKVAMANARLIHRPKTATNTSIYMHLFACGMTTAIYGCRQIGLDPDSTNSSLRLSMKGPANEG